MKEERSKKKEREGWVRGCCVACFVVFSCAQASAARFTLSITQWWQQAPPTRTHKCEVRKAICI